MHSDYDLSMLFLQPEGQDGSVVLPHEYLEFHLLLCVQRLLLGKLELDLQEQLLPNHRFQHHMENLWLMNGLQHILPEFQG